MLLQEDIGIILLTNRELGALFRFPKGRCFFRGHIFRRTAIYMYKPDKNGGKVMFIRTIKIKRPNLLAAALVVVIVCLIAIVGLTAYRVTAKSEYELKNEQQRQEFIKEMGWETDEGFDDCKQITIPEEFNEVYNSYNELQKQQGFDLSRYKGKTCDIYTYKVRNYKGHEGKDDVNCNLMIFENKLIGGDVSSVELDGFMQGLRSSQK